MTKPNMDLSELLAKQEGVDEGDQRSGRGWSKTGAEGRLVGHLYFHMGHDADLVCDTW